MKLYFDLHTHTIASGHGTRQTITELAGKAAASGMTALGISDHAPQTPNAAGESYFRCLSFAPRRRCGIRLLYGAELNICGDRGQPDLPADIISRLDYCIASMHIPNRSAAHTMEENTQTYLAVMQHPNVRIIGHCDDNRYPVDYSALVQAAKANGVVLELNNASLMDGSFRTGSAPQMLSILQLCKQYAHPILLSSDSHGTGHLGDCSMLLPLLVQTAFPEQLVLNAQPDGLEQFLDLRR